MGRTQSSGQRTVVKSGGGSQPSQSYTITTTTESERTTKRNKRGEPISVKVKTRTKYCVNGKEVKLNWFDRLRIKFMGNYEKQAFLANKYLKQEKKGIVVKRRN